MKYHIASVSTLLIIGLLTSTSALATPPGKGPVYHQPPRQSAPPPPPRQHVAPPPPRQHYTPPPQRRVAPPPPPPPRQTYRQVRPLPRSSYASHHHYGRTWQMGHAIPRTVAYHEVPSPHIYNLAPPPRNHNYVRVGRDILLIALGTGLIVNAIYDLAY